MIELALENTDLVSGGMEVFLTSAIIGLCVLEGYKRCAGTLVLEPYMRDSVIETKTDVYDVYGFWIGYDIDTYIVSEQKYNSIYIF